MVCKKCGKGKCACGGMVKKAKGGMVKKAMGGMVSDRMGRAMPSSPVSSGKPAMGGGMAGGRGMLSSRVPTGKPPMGGAVARPISSTTVSRDMGGSNPAVMPVAMKKGGMAKKRGK